MGNRRVHRVVIALAASVGVFGATPAHADPVATTLQPTSLTSSSAKLTGTANPTDAYSAWTFEYGTSTAYGRNTGLHHIAPGFTFLAETITSLSPHARYHYRLVVVQGLYDQQGSDGADVSFTTLKQSSANKLGRIFLKRRRLEVTHGVVSIPLKCAGKSGARCKARISLSTRTKIGKRVKTIRCGTGSFVASAGHSHAVRAEPSHGCDVLLQSARQHRLRATLKASQTTHQAPLRIAVTLVGT